MKKPISLYVNIIWTDLFRDIWKEEPQRIEGASQEG
jgi:hypothetical protein